MLRYEQLGLSVQPLCSLCLCGLYSCKVITETQRTQRLHRDTTCRSRTRLRGRPVALYRESMPGQSNSSFLNARTYLPYFLMLLIFVGGVWLILGAGAGLQPADTRRNSPTRPGIVEKRPMAKLSGPGQHSTHPDRRHLNCRGLVPKTLPPARSATGNGRDDRGHRAWSVGPGLFLSYSAAFSFPSSITGNVATAQPDRRRDLHVHRRHGGEHTAPTRKRIGGGDDQSREHHRAFFARHRALAFSLSRPRASRNLFQCICVIHRCCDEHHCLSGARPDP